MFRIKYFQFHYFKPLTLEYRGMKQKNSAQWTFAIFVIKNEPYFRQQNTGFSKKFQTIPAYSPPEGVCTL